MRCPICDNAEVEKRQDAHTGENYLSCSACNFHSALFLRTGEYLATCLQCVRTTAHDKDNNCKVCGKKENR